MGKYGIKESKEAVVAIFSVIKLVYDIAKDGVQTTDAWTLLTAFMDYNFRKVLNDGIQGVSVIKSELLELDAAERAELWALVNQKFLDLKLNYNLSGEEAMRAMALVTQLFGHLSEDPLG
jgi:hypothetical protein